MMAVREPLPKHQRGTRFPSGLIPRLALAVFAAALTTAAAVSPAAENDAPFLAENNAAMARMMDGMTISRPAMSMPTLPA
jgi:hypothetical protein